MVLRLSRKQKVLGSIPSVAFLHSHLFLLSNFLFLVLTPISFVFLFSHAFLQSPFYVFHISLGDLDNYHHHE